MIDILINAGLQCYNIIVKHIIAAFQHPLKEWVCQIDTERLVFIDETGIHLAMARDYGRAIQGKRVFEAKRQRPKMSEKYTWISAFCTSGLFAHFELKGSMTGNAFLFYVNSIFAVFQEA